MKTVVIYKSKSGFAKKYAEWIAEELSADIFDASKVKIGDIGAYDNIVYGGGLYELGISGVKLITRNLDKLEGKKIAVFGTGATPPREQDIISVRDRNFTPEQLTKLRFFYLRGGFDFSKLPPIYKFLMLLLKLKIKMKKESRRVPDEKGMLAAYDKPADFARRKNIEELVAYIRG